MRYLKLFEAFESVILSKTLSFIKDDSSKKEFMNIIDRICSKIDFPKSELKDEYFKYLSFYPALKLSAMTGDEPCDAKSENAFPEHQVAGEVCKDGKILRMWGTRRRQVECPICKGTGVKSKKPEIKLIKFWFSADGKFINTTAVDGVIRKPSGKFTGLNLHDYTVVGTVPLSDIENGDVVLVNINTIDTICYMYLDRGNKYAIQDRHNGNSPSGTEWKKFGTRSWVLAGSGDYNGPIKLLKPKDKEEAEEEEEPDPYTWNVLIDTGRYSNLKVDPTSADVQEKIKDANFAIVLDFGKLKESGFKTTYSTRAERDESREGALALEKPEDIKKANLERYIKALSDKITEGDELTKVTRIIPKLMGGPNTIVYIYTGRNLSALDSLSTRLYRFLSGDDKEYNAKEIISTIKSRYKSEIEYSSELNSTLTGVKKLLEKNSKTDHLILFNKVFELSKKINQKIIMTKVESIEDIEYIYQTLSTISRMTTSSRNESSNLRSFMERLSYSDVDRSYSRLLDLDEEDIKETIKGLDSIERYINRI